MKIKTYIVIAKSGVIRTRKGKPYLRAGEIAINLSIDIPDAAFESFYPKASIKVPDEIITKPSPRIEALP